MKKHFVKVFAKSAATPAWVYFCSTLFLYFSRFGPGLSLLPLCPELITDFLWSNVVFHAFWLSDCSAPRVEITTIQCNLDFTFMHSYFLQVKGQSLSSPSSVFAPIVSATCRAGMMTVKVETQDNFLGVVQSRDYRKPECSGYGENTRITYLRINMLAQTTEKEYCGVFISQVILHSHRLKNQFMVIR